MIRSRPRLSYMSYANDTRKNSLSPANMAGILEYWCQLAEAVEENLQLNHDRVLAWFMAASGSVEGADADLREPHVIVSVSLCREGPRPQVIFDSSQATTTEERALIELSNIDRIYITPNRLRSDFSENDDCISNLASFISEQLTCDFQ
jgi:hypothetical protein